MTNQTKQIFLTFSIIISCGVAVVSFFLVSANHDAFSYGSQLLVNFMYVYLIFVMLRTVVLVILSFGESYFRKELGEPNDFPVVSIIMPCYNEEVVIEKAIQSVVELDYPNYEVLVVDDGSTDFTLEHALKLQKKGRIRVVSHENSGKSGALNRGISEAVGDYVLCMDADSMLKPDVLKLAMIYFERNPKLAAVAGSVVLGNTNNLLTKFQRLEYVVGLNFHKSAQSFFKMVNIVPGPIGVFKKSALMKVGCYHHDTFAEDCDLSIRLLLEGYELAYCPEMIAVTEAPEDVRSLIGQRYRWSRGITQAIMKNSSWLLRPHKSLRNFQLILYMVVESILIPLANFAITVFCVEHALLVSGQQMIGPYYVSLTLLDVALSIYCVSGEQHSVSLVGLSVINRLTYGLGLEVIRFFSTFDELFGLPMKWGKLVRKGL